MPQETSPLRGDTHTARRGPPEWHQLALVISGMRDIAQVRYAIHSEKSSVVRSAHHDDVEAIWMRWTNRRHRRARGTANGKATQRMTDDDDLATRCPCRQGMRFAGRGPFRFSGW